MSIQINSNATLQVVLAAAPATNQLPCSASYVDQGGSGADNTLNTNGTTPVTLVGSPASGVERLISNVSIPNADTASATVTVNKVVSGTAYRVVKVTLQPGYALYYDGAWRVMDPNGNFLCDVTISSGTVTSNQGTAAAITAPWPVELSNGTTAVGTSSAPLRIDPVGTTTQPVSLASLPSLAAGSNAIGSVSVSNLPITQGVNLTELDGTALAGPTAWGTAPASGSQVLNVNANIVSGGGGGGNVNVTEWNTVALGSPTAWGSAPSGDVIGVNANILNSSIAVTGTFYPATQPVSGTVSATQGTSPWVVHGLVGTGGANSGNPVKIGGVYNSTQPTATAGEIIDAQMTSRGAYLVATGVDAFNAAVSNFPTTQGVNLTQLDGTALGAPSNYGTSPGAVAVQGVNAFVTNSVAVTGTFYQATQPVSLASLPALSAGSAAIGSVTVSNFPATQPVSGTVTANAGSGTFTVSDTNFVVQASTTSGQKGLLVQGAVTTSAPSYTTAETSPLSLTTAGAVRVDASATTQPVSGTFWQTTQPVSLTSLPALASGSNTIGAVTQASGPWTFNLTQVDGTALGAPSAYGTAPSGTVLGVNAYVTNVTYAQGSTTSGQSGSLMQGAVTTTAPTYTTAQTSPLSIDTSGGLRISDSGIAQALMTTNFSATGTTTFGTSATKFLNLVNVTYASYTSTGSFTVSIEDGSGNVLYSFVTGTIGTSITIYNYIAFSPLRIPMNNGSNPPKVVCSGTAPSTGYIAVTLGYQ
jgi:hypothetical protein